MTQPLEKQKSVQNGVKRAVFAAISILLEAALLLLLFTRLNEIAEWINVGTRVLSALLVLGIYSQHTTSTMKMPWIILILVFPIFGTCMYLMIGLNGSAFKMRKRFEEIDKILLPRLKQDERVLKELEEQSPYAANIARYLIRYSGYPVYKNTDIVYYSEAKDGIKAQKEELRKAKHFIFMEYHAIEDAESWHEIQEVLEDRVKAGVEVRLIYDDMGSIGFINTDFVKRMEEKGIHCRVFNPFAPGLNIFLNNRDHRKITVIDGEVGFTGGYNLANEYFNITHPYGYWKDTGVRLKGEAVRNLTITFLEMWNSVRANDKDDRKFERFLPDVEYCAEEEAYIQPYADSPMDTEQVGENVYISMAESAKKYAWFVTPYLIITDEMIHALGLAAKRGVDVRVITPGIPDKKMVYGVTRSYYNTLTRNGVKVYEYTPGFCHCKMCVVDDEMAVCGTINLDYRSLYHHFENGCLYYRCKAVGDTKKDFEEMFAASRDVTEEYTSGRSARLRLWHMILRLFAPLL